MFGRSVPQAILDAQGTPVRQWGARAIFHPHTSNPIDLLWDRQQCECQGDRDPQPILDWLNKTGIPKLKKTKEFMFLEAGDNETVEVKDGQFTLQVNPNSSYGYLYMGAWQYYPAGCTYELKELPQHIKMGADNPNNLPQWSGKLDPPEIGAKVVCSMNGEWRGTVVDYFSEHGYVGFRIDAYRRPEYHKKQQPGKRLVLMFGSDLVEVKAPKRAA